MVEKNAQLEVQNVQDAQYASPDSDDLMIGEVVLPWGGTPGFDIGDEIEVSSDTPEVVFVLDDIPGAPDAQDIVVTDNDSEQVEISADPEDVNMWKWDVPNFLPWLEKMFKEVPHHSGYDSTGLEKAISYFEALDREITKAMRTDFKNEIDSAQAEKAREQIENGLDRLVERLEKVNSSKFKRKNKAKKSKSWAESMGLVKGGAEDADLIKEAQKATRINGITIVVPLLISRIARVCINGMVSAGHDIEDMYKRQVDEYNLDKREQAELSQLLADMGYPMMQDRGYPPGEHVEIHRPDNFDWSAQYRG